MEQDKKNGDKNDKAADSREKGSGNDGAQKNNDAGKTEDKKASQNSVNDEPQESAGKKENKLQDAQSKKADAAENADLKNDAGKNGASENSVLENDGEKEKGDEQKNASAEKDDKQEKKMPTPSDKNVGDEQHDSGTDNAENAEDDDDSGNNRPKKALKAIIYTMCIIIASLLITFGVLYSVTDYLGMFRPDKAADIKIPANASTQQIAALLKDNGIIRSPFVFKLYVMVSRRHNFKSGLYTLNSEMSYDDISRALRSASARKTVKVTIPEGFTLQKIGDLLQKDNVCTKEAFLTSAKSADIKFDFQSKIPNDKNRFYRLEGYVFPDTYDFFVGQSSDSVVKKMLENFDERFDDGLRLKAKSSGMTVDQLVTLASIIQTECSKPSEMPKVSSVFHNRLQTGVNGQKLLQSDATIFYVTRVIEPVLSASSVNIETAYNTYKHQGLPPGPICNPGLAAINAALSPESTPYFYFVTDKAGNYYYAKTYAEHIKNCKKALQTGKAIGTGVTK